jgi:hypothetical protein
LLKEHRQRVDETLYDHGKKVWSYTKNLINDDLTDITLPKWYEEYKDRILSNLHDTPTIHWYTIFHDIGKSKCLEIDENGRWHFPNHSEHSYKLSKKLGFGKTISNLIRYDMIFHDWNEDPFKFKLTTKDYCTILIATIAALNANAESFGGTSSESFKIKMKRLTKKGKKFLDKLFNHKRAYIFTRDDLSNSQKMVQSCHSILEMSRNYTEIKDHPSIIICKANDLNHLNEIKNYLNENKIKNYSFYENDLNGELTSISTIPLEYSQKDIFNQFKLIK